MPAAFRHLAPPVRVFFGEHCLDQLAGEVRRTGGKRVVVLCGRTLASAEPGLATVRAALGDLFGGAFTEVVAQSPLASVEAAADALRRTEAGAVVALGGGSAIVTARSASILLAEGRSAEELATRFTPGSAPRSPRLDAPKLPQFVVPTTPTTAYGKAGAAVTLPGAGRRLALFDPKVRAQALFLHPALFEATPPPLVVDAALDAFALAIQGLESPRREPLADASLLHGVRLIRRALEGGEVTHGGDLMLAAQLIGEGTDHSGSALASALGHAIGARLGGANGSAKAILLPHTLRFNAPATSDRLRDIAEVLGLPADASAEAVADECRRFATALGAPVRLRDLGLAREALPAIAEDARHDWFLAQNPRPVTPDALAALLEDAW